MKPLKTLSLVLAASTALAAPAMAQYGGHRGGQGEAILYANPDFTGQSIRVTGTVPRLTQYRFNDKASSIRITGGAWEVCVDADFRGRCEIIEYREDRLNEIRLNDNISSIRPVTYRGDRWDRYERDRRGPRYDHDRGRDRDWDRGHGNGYRQNAPIVLFEHGDFRGKSLPLNGAVAHLNQLGFNDNVSSIAVQSGAWEVCTDPNFRGRCEVIYASQSNLGHYRLNDNISSIRPAGRGGYGRPW
ncbi:beta/gamma crystallin-related protein [Henriciella litoralis]|uniref:beta/gamma crystallin-related protein n=1 Tax=Henriciella litoralis TaxID=568102 RepID=UPI000A035263|nr:beta/gamma crystallin-related protein [Henriciella litoralis]